MAIQVSNSAAQLLNPGQAMTFQNVVKCGDRQCFNRQLPTSVKLRAKGIHDVSFHGNITGAAGASLQLAIALEGQAIPTTAMQATPATANALVNVSARTLVKDCCCDVDRISVINSGATPITVAPNAVLIII